MERREFFRSLIAAGAVPRKTRKRVPQSHAGDIRLYHGPMTIPPHVYEAVREDPTPHRATGRGSHLVSRFADPDATVWLFRCQIPEHRGMVGEIVRTPIGRIRVHCWSAATPGGYRTPAELIEVRPPEIAVSMTSRAMPMSPDGDARVSPDWKAVTRPNDEEEDDD